MAAAKENKLPLEIAQKLLLKEKELTDYLKYLRCKQPPKKIVLNDSILKDVSTNVTHGKPKKACNLVRTYVEQYLRLMRQLNRIDNSMGKKIVQKIIEYLAEFPMISFLIEVLNSFGKEKKRLCLNENVLMQHVSDQMVPLFQKVLEKIQLLKKESESKKLMELGHRIENLQAMINHSRHTVKGKETQDMFQNLQLDRIDKYILMEENINKAEKNYGKFSESLCKNKEVFSNINKVCFQIHHLADSK